jgi:uncharacterized protein (DUF433 family)
MEVLMVQQWQDRITLDPDIHHGDPCIKGTRIPVGAILGSLADGMTFGQIMENYPQLNEVDIYAALAYAAEVMRQEILFPLSS